MQIVNFDLHQNELNLTSELPLIIYFSLPNFEKMLQQELKKTLSHFGREVTKRAISFFEKVSAEEIEISKEASGRPTVKIKSKTCTWDVSYSHSSNYFVLALTKDELIGVDLEKIRERSQIPKIADRLMSAEEIKIYKAFTNRVEQLQFFYQFWTDYEACFKAGKESAVSVQSILVDDFSLSVAIQKK